MHRLLALYPLALAGLAVVAFAAPRRNGPVALAQVFLPYLYVPLLLLVPALGDPLIATATVLALAGLAAVLVPPWLSRRAEPPPDATAVEVATWNALIDNDPRRVVAGVRALDVDVLALQEVTPDAAALLDADPLLRARYPYRVLRPEQGLGVLSRLPVLADGVCHEPRLREGSRVLWARLPGLAVVVAHPYPPERRLWRLPLRDWYDATPRDAEISFVRSVVDGLLAAAEPVLVAGDFNLTDREPAIDALTAGLTDVVRAAGRGPNGSWGPLWLRRRGLTVLRIDRLLAGPGVLPVRAWTERSWRGSDHCPLRATIALTVTPSREVHNGQHPPGRATTPR